MRIRHSGFGVACGPVLALALSAAVAWGQPPPSSKLTGALTEIDGVPVLKVWGTPREQGYAHGYLLAEKIVPLLDRLLTNGVVFTVDSFQNGLLAHLDLMRIEPKYEEELRGMLAGIEARLGEPARIPALQRALTYDDLRAVNSVDLRNASFGCSAFAAWGAMTADGDTISGRNWEWPWEPALFESQLVSVRLPSADGKTPGLVSLFFPTCIGTTTAMNGDGLTASMLDVVPRNPALQERFVCRTLTHRDVLEAAHPRDALADSATILRRRPALMGENVFVSRPFTGTGVGALVFEHDGYVPDGEGVTVREPERDTCFLVCTNHYRKRAQPHPQLDCPRYATLTGKLQEIAESRGAKHVTVDVAWQMLESAPLRELRTYHRAVFEPNKRLMHVALPENGDPKSHGKIVTLDLQKLLQRPGE